MPQDENFQYDVVLTLLHEDEGLAAEIHDLLADRISVFFYSDQQKERELPGKDGVEEFTQVFRTDSRLVVVLFRPGWGETKWTRVEASAIRDRFWDEGADFLLVVPVDDSTSIPPWIPRTHLWADINRLGVSGVVAAIELRVRERGKAVPPLTPELVAAKLEESARRQAEVDSFLRSERGRAAADAEFAQIKSELKGRAPALRMSVTTKYDRDITLFFAQATLSMTWIVDSANRLDGSELLVQLWRGVRSPDVSHEMRGADRPAARLRLGYDVRAGVCGWRELHGGDRFFTWKNLADHCLMILLRFGHGQEVSL